MRTNTIADNHFVNESLFVTLERKFNIFVAHSGVGFFLSLSFFFRIFFVSLIFFNIFNFYS